MNRFITRAAAVAMAVAVAFGASACAGGKPSKDEFRNALKSAPQVGQMTDGQKDQFNKLADCIADKSYDKLSPEGLKKLIELAKQAAVDPSNSEDLAEADQKVLGEAALECLPGQG